MFWWDATSYKVLYYVILPDIFTSGYCQPPYINHRIVVSSFIVVLVECSSYMTMTIIAMRNIKTIKVYQNKLCIIPSYILSALTTELSYWLGSSMSSFTYLYYSFQSVVVTCGFLRMQSHQLTLYRALQSRVSRHRSLLYQCAQWMARTMKFQVEESTQCSMEILLSLDQFCVLPF